MNRRQFLQSAAIAMIKPAPRVNWPIGCFNRPWTNWSFDEALTAMKAAGYDQIGLLTATKDDPFIAASATPEYLDSLQKKISGHGLRAIMGALRSRHDVPLTDSIRNVQQQIDNAQRLSLRYVLSFGVDKSTEYDHYYRVMANAAPYAEERGIALVMKPHGGASGASEEILRCIGNVKHRNFKIWYDAGNIIYYTGKDPLTELEPVAQHVTGFCAKDCAQPKGDVMIQFGAGKVDFNAIFRKLKSAGFNGPVMVECCAPGPTPEEVAANARRNREFLQQTFERV